MPDHKPEILVIDSEYLIAFDTAQILSEELGCEVETATPEAGREVLRTRRFDIVVIEVQDDRAMTEALAAAACAAGGAVVFTSTSEEDRDGVDGFCQWPVVLKPFPSGEIARSVTAILHARRPTAR
ncbi:response regulator transcription factor [Nitratireductor alexandrii]|uniref:response regulator transcription factor n=1 Tax=Nitratireductor alexandrii TaxID=2448161 RepID=UPI000FDB0A56|nr:response regulator transcription factor [Nitratireductor alexandrii]